jgi:hypothetical protein
MTAKIDIGDGLHALGTSVMLESFAGCVYLLMTFIRCQLPSTGLYKLQPSKESCNH